MSIVREPCKINHKLTSEMPVTTLLCIQGLPAFKMLKIPKLCMSHSAVFLSWYIGDHQHTTLAVRPSVSVSSPQGSQSQRQRCHFGSTKNFHTKIHCTSCNILLTVRNKLFLDWQKVCTSFYYLTKHKSKHNSIVLTRCSQLIS